MLDVGYDSGANNAPDGFTAAVSNTARFLVNHPMDHL
jgi:hypothetical protein